MAKSQSETKLAWVPTPEMSAVLDQLAMGYSLNAASRLTGVAPMTVWSWVNELAFSAQFRDEIQKRAALFQENLAAIEDQQIIQATSLYGKVLAGEVKPDGLGNLPPEYRYAVELLRNTRWKQKAGGHKQFGAP
jgi:hypothetical protein